MHVPKVAVVIEDEAFLKGIEVLQKRSSSLLCISSINIHEALKGFLLMANGGRGTLGDNKLSLNGKIVLRATQLSAPAPAPFFTPFSQVGELHLHGNTKWFLV